MPKPSQYVDRTNAHFQAHATCAECGWEAFSCRGRTQMLNLQQRVREHTHHQAHEVTIDVHRLTTYRPKPPT